jgi:hypothetical protein
MRCIGANAREAGAAPLAHSDPGVEPVLNGAGWNALERFPMDGTARGSIDRERAHWTAD